MPVVEFKLHKINRRGLCVPDFVIAGSPWVDHLNFTQIGWVHPVEKRPYYVPDTLVELSKEDFIQKIKTLCTDDEGQVFVPEMEMYGNVLDEEGNPIIHIGDDADIYLSQWYDNYVETCDALEEL
jgi:hypothetical protein